MTGNEALYAGISPRKTSNGGEFAARRGSSRHRGRDSVAKVGTVVRGSGNGRVVSIVRNDPTYGLTLDVEYFIGTKRLLVRDAHLSKVLVEVGEEVSVETTLCLTGGVKGAAGSGVSESPHLHEGVYVDGAWRDPDGWLNERDSIQERTTSEENDMPHYAQADGDDGPIKKGFTYTWDADGVLRPVGKTESDLLTTHATDGVGGLARPTPTTVSAWRLAVMAAQNGLLEASWTGLEPTLTGRVTRKVGKEWVSSFPTVAGSAGSGSDQAVLDAIAALAKKLTPDTILRRFRDFWSTGK